MKKCVAIGLFALMMGALSACMTNSEPTENDAKEALNKVWQKQSGYACYGSYADFPVKNRTEHTAEVDEPVVKAGLIKEVSKVPNPHKFESKWLVTYDLTEEGKKYLRSVQSKGNCFQWGTAKVVKIETILKSKMMEKTYEVSYKVVLDMAPWAKEIKTGWYNTETRKQTFEGKTYHALLVQNVDGDWITK